MVVKRRCLFSSGSVGRRGLTDLRAILHLLKHLLDFGGSKLAGVVLLQRVELAGGDLVPLGGIRLGMEVASSTKRCATAGCSCIDLGRMAER
jgi:hypothetical protein